MYYNLFTFSLVFCIYNYLALFWYIFVSYLFLNSDYSTYLCSRNNE